MPRQLASAPTRTIVLVSFQTVRGEVYLQTSPRGDLIDHGSTEEAARYFSNVAGTGRAGDDPMSLAEREAQLRHQVEFDPRVSTVTQAEVAQLFGSELPLLATLGFPIPGSDGRLVVVGARIEGDRARAFHEAATPVGKVAQNLS